MFGDISPLWWALGGGSVALLAIASYLKFRPEKPLTEKQRGKLVNKIKKEQMKLAQERALEIVTIRMEEVQKTQRHGNDKKTLEGELARIKYRRKAPR